MRRTPRAAVLMTLALVLALATAPTVPAAQAAVGEGVAPPRVIWTLPSAARIGTRVEVSVRLRPFVRDQLVTLQQRVNGRWQYVDDDVVRRRGARLSFTQVTSGPSRFRLFVKDLVDRVDGPDRATASRVLRGTPSGTTLATRRVSVTTHGSQLGSDSTEASASDDGRVVAFTSNAGNAVPRDGDRRFDVFVKDTRTGALSRISHGPRGRQGDGASTSPSVSGDGRVVAFVSRASNLVPGDRNGRPDVFVWERATDRVTRVGLDATEPVLSADGRYVAFTSSAGEVVVRDRTTGAATRLPTGNGASRHPSISADGRYVAFDTDATDLTPEAQPGVVLWDRTTGTTTLVEADASRPRLSADGTVVAYESRADELGAGGHTQVYRETLATGTPVLLSARDGVAGDADSRLDDVSADGSLVLLSSDAALTADDVDRDYCESEAECFDNRSDAYTADATGAVVLVSRSAGGAVTEFETEGRDLLADGSGVVFGSRDALVPGQSSRSPYLSVFSYREVFVRDLD